MCWIMHRHAASVAVKQRRDFHCLIVSTVSSEASVIAKEERSGPLYMYLGDGTWPEAGDERRVLFENDNMIRNECGNERL